MTRQDLIERIGQATGGEHPRKLVAEVVDTAFARIADALRDDGRFTWPGFGTFTVRDRAARSGKNPRSGEPIEIPASRAVGFRPARALKDEL